MNIIERDRAAKGLHWLKQDISTMLRKEPKHKQYVRLRYHDILTITAILLMALGMLWAGLWIVFFR